MDGEDHGQLACNIDERANQWPEVLLSIDV
jgi:hypothetical protein